MEAPDIDLTDINDHESLNCRGVIRAGDVKDLADSIHQKGLIQPIVVRPSKNGTHKYDLVCGFRRFKAFKMLNKSTQKFERIPAIIKDISTIDATILNLEENAKRSSLNMAQEADAVKRIIDMDPDLTENQIARKIGQSRGWVQVRKILLRLAPEIQREAAQGSITTNQVREMSNFEPQKQYDYVKAVKDAKLRGVKFKKMDTKPVKMPKMARTRQDIFAMQSHIAKVQGPCLATRVLGWAAQELPDSEIFEDLHVICEERDGKTYKGEDWTVPEELGTAEVV